MKKHLSTLLPPGVETMFMELGSYDSICYICRTAYLLQKGYHATPHISGRDSGTWQGNKTTFAL